MFSIKNNDKYEEIIKYSKFISLIFRVYSKEEVNTILNEIKKEYPNATHYCYGYVIDNDIKSSDDGEPSKTAGIPILNQIIGHNLNYTLIVVIRYFGGIKLGIGGLTRAYSNSAAEVLKKAEFNVYNEYECFLVKTDFSNKKLIDKLMHNYTLFGVDFSEINDGKIAYNFGVKDENSNISEIKNHCDCEIISLGKKMIAEGKNGKNNKD